MDHGDHRHVIEILFHPILVHFPIAFYFLELLLLIIWVKKSEPQYLHFAKLTFSLGYGFMIAALASGYIDAGGWANITGLVQRHFLGALSVLVLYNLRGAYWLKAKSGSKKFAAVQISGALIGNILVGITGFYGGRLVYG